MYKLRYIGHHLDFSTSCYLLTCDYQQYNTSGMFVAKNVGVAIGILFLTSVDLKMYVIRRSQAVVTTSGFPSYLLSGGCKIRSVFTIM